MSITIRFADDKKDPFMDIQSFPNDESEYHRTSHYEDMKMLRRNPTPTDEVVETILERGSVDIHKEDNIFDENSRRVLKKTIDGSVWRMIIAVDRGGAGDQPDLNLISIFSLSHQGNPCETGYGLEGFKSF